jgi:hypothetical protein
MDAAIRPRSAPEKAVGAFFGARPPDGPTGGKRATEARKPGNFGNSGNSGNYRRGERQGQWPTQPTCATVVRRGWRTQMTNARTSNILAIAAMLAISSIAMALPHPPETKTDGASLPPLPKTDIYPLLAEPALEPIAWATYFSTRLATTTDRPLLPPPNLTQSPPACQWSSIRYARGEKQCNPAGDAKA